MSEFTKSNWYDKMWLVVILCIIIFPIGLYALWKNTIIPPGWKILGTIIISIIVFNQINNVFTDSPVSVDNSTTSGLAVAPLTQFQIDSLAEVEQQAEIEERKNNTITAVSLMANYTENQLRADEKFRGKYFFVEGTIHEIKKGLSDEIYVTLNSGELIMYVRCYFNDKNIAMNLEKGMNVTFYGKCDGFYLGVDMKDCRLVANWEDIEKENPT